MTTDGTILVEHLSKSFGPVRAVDDLSFQVAPGRVTGFLGPNGAGKTTTLRMLLGLVRPTSGTATIGGQTYGQIRRPLRTVGAALEAASFHPGRTALDHLRLYTPQVGVPDARAGEVLELVGLSAAADRRVGGFSLGMRQRLALATTLLGDPRVLLLDEPANGLDPEGIRWLRGFLRMLAAEGRTVLVSSHVLSEVEQTVDDVVIIARGRLAHASSLPDLARMARVQVRAVSPDAAGLAALVERSAWTRTDAGDPRVADLWDVDAATVGAAAFAAGVELHELTSRDPGPRRAVPPARRRRRDRRGGCLMRAALVTEYRKLVTTRLWWILLLCMAVYMAFLSAVLGWGISQGGGMASTSTGGAGRPRAGAGRRGAGRLHGRRDVRLRVPAAGRRARGRLRVPAPDHHPDAARRAAPDAAGVRQGRLRRRPGARLRRRRHARRRRCGRRRAWRCWTSRRSSTRPRRGGPSPCPRSRWPSGRSSASASAPS